VTDINYKVIGQKIRERRQSLGVTQEFIANKLDVNPSHISNIECGRANPSLTALIRIANILQCSVDYFISEEYSFEFNNTHETNLEEQILTKLKHCDINKKQKLLKIVDIL